MGLVKYVENGEGISEMEIEEAKKYIAILSQKSLRHSKLVIDEALINPQPIFLVEKDQEAVNRQIYEKKLLIEKQY